MKIKYLGFYLFAFILALPIPLKYSAIALILMLFNTLCFYKEFNLKISLWIILSTLFVLIDPIRSMLFENFSFKGLAETKLSFLIIPFFLSSIKKTLCPQKKYILRFFVIGVFTYVMYAIGYMIYFYYTYTNYTFNFTDSYIMYMLYNYLPGAYHHTYIGIYIAFSIIILTHEVRTKKLRVIKLILIMMLVTLFFMQLYIGSKMTMLISFLALIYYLFLTVKNKNKLKLTIVSLLVVFITFGFVIRDWLLISIKNSLGHRLEYMQASLDLIKNNSLFGIGLKNIKSNIILINGESKVLIPHNLYIHEYLSNGIFGFGLIVIIFYFLFIKAYQLKDNLFLTFVFMCFLLGFSEDFLYLQRGVFFFIFFVTLFLTNTSNKKAI